MIENDISKAVEAYNSTLAGLWGSKAQSGQMFEQLIHDVVSTIPHLRPSVGDLDYLSASIGDYSINNLQVDIHVRDRETNELVACIESKVYVDACFCKRAVSDFMSISRTKDCTKNTKFILFAGQKAIAENTLNYELAWLKEFTSKQMHLFIVNDVKQRNSQKPLHKAKYGLDIKELNRFRSLLAGDSAGLPGLMICQGLFSL